MKILETVTNLDGGGVDTLVLNYCSRIIPKHHFDFLVRSSSEGICERPLRELGCNVYHLPSIRKHPIGYIRTLYQALKNGQYDIVHTHGNYKSIVILILAKWLGIKVRIAHSHIANIPETRREKIARKILVPAAKYFATDLFACGRDAAIWMWGKKAYEAGRVFIMTNAVDTKHFAFSEKNRKKYRKELNIENRFVIGNVARLSYQKNHTFLIKVFSELLKRDENALLLLIGRGELEEQIRQEVRELSLEKQVVFMGIRNDVPELLSTLDVFVLPSHFEGLPVTLVEVQANGLPAVASDTITDEIQLSSNLIYLSLNQPAEKWAETICSLRGKRMEIDMASNGYDIDAAAVLLKKKYEELYANSCAK